MPRSWRLHGNRSHRARYTDDELRQIIAWLPSDPEIDAYVLFNNIPRVKDVRRFRELLQPSQELVGRRGAV